MFAPVLNPGIEEPVTDDEPKYCAIHETILAPGSGGYNRAKTLGSKNMPRVVNSGRGLKNGGLHKSEASLVTSHKKY